MTKQMPDTDRAAALEAELVTMRTTLDRKIGAVRALREALQPFAVAAIIPASPARARLLTEDSFQHARTAMLSTDVHA